MESNVHEKLEKNKDNIGHAKESEYFVSLARYLLKLIAAWPLDEDASISEKIYKYCVTFLLFITVAPLYGPTVLFLIFKARVIRTKIKILTLLMLCLGNMGKYILLLKYSNEIKKCVWQTKEDWKDITIQQDYKNMLYRAKIGRSLALLSTSSIYISCILNRVVTPIALGNIVVNNVTIRRTPIPCYYIIFDDQKTPVYEIIYFSQVISGLVLYTIASATFCLTTYFVMHVCGQLDILMRKLKDIETANSDVGNAENLIRITILHQIKIRSFMKKMSEIVQYMSLVEVATSNFIICIALYSINWDYTNKVSVVGYGIILITYTFNLFIYCYIGELLDTQNMKVMEITRTIDWHNILTTSARNLVLIILVANDPQKLVAGKILDLTLNNFTTMFKTAVGYFNILRQTISSS